MKVGDKVKIIDTMFHNIPLSAEGVVVFSSENDLNSIDGYVTVKSDKCFSSQILKSTQVELLEESKVGAVIGIDRPAKAGDIMRVNPLATQVGGSHYQLPIQPIDYIVKNNIGYREGNVIKYTTRHKTKNGAEDIKKAIHYLEMILEDYENE